MGLFISVVIAFAYICLFSSNWFLISSTTAKRASKENVLHFKNEHCTIFNCANARFKLFFSIDSNFIIKIRIKKELFIYNSLISFCFTQPIESFTNLTLYHF